MASGPDGPDEGERPVCMIDDADGGWVSFDKVHRVARKAHRCDECGRTIEPGETYWPWTGLGEGRFDHGKMCVHCEAAAQWLVEVCNGYLFHGIAQDLREHWDEDWSYRNLWLGRAVVGMGRRWRRLDGSLMPVPDRPVLPDAL
jgi:hypothetical protein